jgi:predicted esterase
MARPAALALLLLAFAAEPLLAEEPGARVEDWTAADGLACRVRGPTGPGPADLVVVLHGRDLDRHWGFAAHDPRTFRRADLVVCPDGPVGNGHGGFRFPDDAAARERVRALVRELRSLHEVRRVLLYGHGEGADFALAMAGEREGEVQGVLAHAPSGIPVALPGERVPVALLHGTDDDEVPYHESLYLREALLDARPLRVHLATLFGAGHAEEPEVADGLLTLLQGLATEDPAEAVRRLRATRGQGPWADLTAHYLLAHNLEGVAGPEGERLGQEVRDGIDALAARHVAAIEGADDAPAAFHRQRAVEVFEQVPRVALAFPRDPAAWKAGSEAIASFFAARAAGDAPAALGIALDVLLPPPHPGAGAVLADLERWTKDPERHGIPDYLAARARELAPAFRRARDAGWARWTSVHEAAR